MGKALFDHFSRAIVAVHFEGGTRVLVPRPPAEVGDSFPFVGAVHIVTAHNPRGVMSDEASNGLAHQALIERAAAMEVGTIATEGSAPDGSMREPGLLMIGLARAEAVSMGRAFAQSAIYEWAPDRLEIVGVLDPGTRLLGWSLESAVPAA